MPLREKKEAIIEMGKSLLQAGLLVRTWGNISCRVNDHQFLITPSGRDYNTLTPEEIVLVNIYDEKSWGTVIPSVEKGVHLDIYKLRPSVNAVIHTHQTQASVLSALDMNLPAVFDKPFQGEVRCAAYGFPGSEALRRNMREELLNGTGNALLMSHHGAVCMGENLTEAFRTAYILERTTERYFMETCRRLYGAQWSPGLFIYSKLFEAYGKEFPQDLVLLGEGELTDGVVTLREDAALTKEGEEAEKSTLPREIFEKIFAARNDIRYVRQIYTPEILTYSALGLDLKTYIDDFAQINGAVMRCAPLDATAIVAALGENHGVLVERCGVLCCGNTLDDVEAMALVTEKNAHAWLVAQFFEGHEITAVPPKECEEMRRFYLEKYAKRFAKSR